MVTLRRRARSALVLVLAAVVGSLAALPVAGAGEPSRAWAPAPDDPGWLRFTAVMGILNDVFVDPPDMARVWSGAVRGAVEALGDPYTVYLEPRQYREFQEEVLEGKYGGIGVVIDQVGSYVTVISVLPGTPAERAGLRPGDRIVRVDGESVVGWTLDAVARRIRGDPGTAVRLEIERGADSSPVAVEVVREEIKLQPLETRLLDDQVAYIRIASFELGLGAQFARVMADYRARGITRYVLDLRSNAGGLLGEAVQVAEQFLPRGPIVRIVERGGKTTTIESSAPEWDYSLVVLVDGGTASAAEIVAAAIKDRGYGLLVGTRTFGKGSVQTVIPFQDGAALKVTTARFLTPSGRVIDGKGIEPLIVVQPEPVRPQVEPFVWKRELRRGVVGLDVLSLQENLAFLGLYRAKPDGVFGPVTAAAVRQFQSAKGMPPTGRVDAATGRALAEEVRQKLIQQKPADPVLEKALEVLRPNFPQALSAGGS